MRQPKKVLDSKKVDRDRNQRSILSYFTMTSKDNLEKNAKSISPKKDPPCNSEDMPVVSTPENSNIEINISTPTINRQESCNISYDLLLSGLKNSSDESLVNDTPQRKKSFCHIFRKKAVSTTNNMDIEKSISSPSMDLQNSEDSASDELSTRLENSSDESLVNDTPQRRSFFRILGPKDRKRLRRSNDLGSPLLQLRKRIKLSQSPIKKSIENEDFNCNKMDCLSPEKENDSVSVPGKCSSISRNILQEVVVPTNNSSPKKHSTDDFVDIENLGDFLNESWGEEFTQNVNLDLSEWKTCLVTDVKETNGGFIAELEEYGKKIRNPSSTTCSIQGYWGDRNLKCKDIVNIKAYYDNSLQTWRIDHTQGYLVKHPDILMSGTCLVSSLFCQRRAILSYLYPGMDSKNVSMLLGSLIHELLQEVLTQKLYSENEIKSLAIQLINKPRSVIQSYEYGLPSIDLEKELLRIVPEMVNFINSYILETEEYKMWPGKIVDVLSTEENFWIPQLGFKGKADFILKTENEGGSQLMPLELKTGRASNAIEHRAQIVLYLMMMSEVGMDTNSGLLLYLKHSILREINPHIAEKQGLVTTRNNLVDYYAANNSTNLKGDEIFTPSLPEPINHHSGCARCPYLTACSAHLKNEREIEDTNPLKELSASALSHLSPDHIQYVFRWAGLLRLEEDERKKDMVFKVSDIWCMPSEDREKRGYCTGKLKIVNVEKRGNKFIHHMQRSQNIPFDLTKSGLTDGDYIVVSTDSRIAVATGYVDSISTDIINLKFDRKLDSTSNKLYIVDRYSPSETLLGFNTSNLFLLLENEDAAARMRRLIIDMELPQFDPVRDINSGREEENFILSRLNRYQRGAIMKTLAAKDYLLIKGLPGTGKTATIVALVRLLVHLKYTVLVTSHTHSAVDNILLRLRKHNVDFLRLGLSTRVHKELKSYCEDFKIESENIHTVEQLELLYNQQSVIAVTCMGCSHSLLSKRSFDFCIVDEATQVLQPSILKSLFSARKFVLLGDPNQLPPVVQSRKASELGFNESLFVKLDRPEVTNTLYLQYRMNYQIMRLANSFTYDGQLQCDDENIVGATIQINQRPEKIANWLYPVLSSDIEYSVLFLNSCPQPSTGRSSAYINQTEADITFTIIEAMSKDITDIGVIAPYRDQVKLLKQMADDRLYKDIEINTVDQFQGRDKEVIIYSCTKYSNEKEGGILADKRRLTVAITRAKRKLIIIGNIPVLKKLAVFEELIGLIPENNIIDVLSL